MEIEKIMDAGGVFQLGDVQYLTPTNLKRKNTTMKMVRLFNPGKANNRTDIIFFEKIKGEWLLSSDNCYLCMESDYLSFFMNWLENGEFLSLENFIKKIRVFAAFYINR